MTRRAWPLAVAAALVAACTFQPAPSSTITPAMSMAPVPGESGDGLRPIESFRAKIEGQVKLPASLVSVGSVNVESAGTPQLVSQGGVNLVSVGTGGLVSVGSTGLVSVGSGSVAYTGMRYQLADIDQAPVAKVTVFLCDAYGKPIQGLPAAVTDADGRYRIDDVPAGFTLVTNAVIEFKDGKRGTLATLVHTGDEGAADINGGTTMAAIRAGAGHEGRDLGAFDRANFQKAVDAANAALNAKNEPDWRDLVAVGKQAAAFETDLKPFREPLPQLRKELGTGTTSVDLLVRTLAVLPTPFPSPSPTPTRTPYPTPTPTATPTPYKNPELDACGPYVRHIFATTLSGGTHMVFRIPQARDRNRQNWPVAFRLTINKNNTEPVELPEGCPYRVEILNNGTVLAVNDSYQIPEGSPEIVLVNAN